MRLPVTPGWRMTERASGYLSSTTLEAAPPRTILRCPNCGGGDCSPGSSIEERCPTCGILLERGSRTISRRLHINLIAVEVLLALAFVVVMYFTLPTRRGMRSKYGGIILSVLGAVFCYQCKTTWLAVDFNFRPPASFITRVK